MIDLAAIQKARAAIGPFIERTPLRNSYYFSDRYGLDTYLKLENWQPTGSFKVRGALNIVQNLSTEERLRGIVAWSAGNHGLGVAYAASIFEAPATIFVPKSTPKSKLEKLSYFPVTLMSGDSYEDAERKARAYAESQKQITIHPYDDWRTVAGAGTVGLEICEQMPEVDAIVVPVGGGGLISGIAIAAKTMDPEIKIIAVQSASSPALTKSLEDQHCYEEFPVEHSICEGLAGGIGKIVYEIAPKMIDEIIHVEESQIRTSIREILEHEQIVAEASAAIVVAALPQVESVPRGSRVAAVISGGNLRMQLLRESFQS
jgi:threonine dehydratase